MFFSKVMGENVSVSVENRSVTKVNIPVSSRVSFHLLIARLLLGKNSIIFYVSGVPLIIALDFL